MSDLGATLFQYQMFIVIWLCNRFKPAKCWLFYLEHWCHWYSYNHRWYEKIIFI